ncbi:hypothetical protein SAMN04487934_11447 [Eubacterium ruminantium]|nr:hypothetical protein SAMN04487934_11447 [Eubacterium ruminantium]
MANLYKEYFNIDPKYYAAVTADLIEQGKVSWKGFYPHETFLKLLETTYKVLSGAATRSIWVEGAYGTGKSHAALTVKSLIDATSEEVIDYFDDYGLSSDLRDKYISLKADSNILTIHRIGSAGINTDMDLVLAIQQSIMAALKAKGIKNHGDASMKDAFLGWVSKKANRDYFSALISDEKYAWDFNGVSVEEVIERLNTGTDKQIETTMNKVMVVLKDAGQYGIFSDVTQMAGWIRSVIKENGLNAILFVWDEFSEYFLNHPVGLTGFQTLAEISESDPFYFMIVAHESTALFADNETAKKILDRFEKPIKIELPENMAFQLMAQAMKTTSDPVLAPKWVKYAQSLNDELIGVRSTIATISKKQAKFGQKTILSDADLQKIVPIHPYAALVLKNIAVLFNSNQRSMFDFIISDDMTDAKGFKWFINTYGPMNDCNLLTVDLLWDFFYGKGQTGLNDDVRGILDNYSMLQGEKLLPDEQRVMKAILLLQAVSLRVTGNELLVPDDQNVDLSFQGTDWTKGKALACANGLIDKGLLFKKPVAGGKMEYCVVSAQGGDDIKKKRDEVISETRTQALITTAKLGEAIVIPASIKARYIVTETGFAGMAAAISNMKSNSKMERFKVIVTIAMDDKEAAQIQQQITKQINMPDNEIIFIETLSPMGKDLYDQYIESMTFSKYNVKKDGAQATHYENQAKSVLTSWRNKITGGAFNLYTPENKSADRKATLADLQDALVSINHKKYYYGLEQYSLNATMYSVFQLAVGAECGITEKLEKAYKNPNKAMSFETALDGAWGVPNYWEDSAKQSLVIVRFKKKVEERIKAGFESASARVSILDIVEELEGAPFGLLPSSLAALVLGFTLKEYATSDYFWSNGSNSETMTVDHLKTAIANALNQTINPTPKYKEEFIVTMSDEVRAFLSCTSKVFHIPTVGSVESARDQVRIKMKGLSFPIWCVKYILDDENLESNKDTLCQVIDDYCGIANTANGSMASESELAETIGKIILSTPNVEDDLSKLIDSEKCRKGMLAYISQFKDGMLPKLASEIGDGGSYIDEVKAKFSAGDANWVWNTSTADEKIDDVILEYQIIAESIKSLGKYTTLKQIIQEWNTKTNQIKMPCEALVKATGDLGPFLEQLSFIKQSGALDEQNKQKFYDLLVTQRESFDAFYKNQLPYFEQDAIAFLGELDHEEIAELYESFPSGQFIKSKSEYYKFIQTEIDKYVQSQWKKKLRDKWIEKTHTKTPSDWSDKFETPILCLFDDSERSTAREMFKIVMSANPSETDAKKAIAWLDGADFYARLDDEKERDACFIRRIIGDNAILLKDIQKVRTELISTIHDKIYDWMDNSAVQNQLQKMMDKQYKLTGCDKALEIIEKMDADQLRKYLRERIQDDAVFGLQILKDV